MGGSSSNQSSTEPESSDMEENPRVDNKPWTSFGREERAPRDINNMFFKPPVSATSHPAHVESAINRSPCDPVTEPIGDKSFQPNDGSYADFFHILNGNLMDNDCNSTSTKSTTTKKKPIRRKTIYTADPRKPLNICQIMQNVHTPDTYPGDHAPGVYHLPDGRAIRLDANIYSPFVRPAQPPAATMRRNRSHFATRDEVDDIRRFLALHWETRPFPYNQHCQRVEIHLLKNVYRLVIGAITGI